MDKWESIILSYLFLYVFETFHSKKLKKEDLLQDFMFIGDGVG